MLTLPEIAETLDYIAGGELEYVIEITRNAPHFSEKSAVESAVIGLMGESLKNTQLALRKLALQVRDVDKELCNGQ